MLLCANLHFMSVCLFWFVIVVISSSFLYYFMFMSKQIVTVRSCIFVFMYVRVSVDECVYVCACEFADTSVHECDMCVSFGSLSLLVFVCLYLDR